MHLANVVEATFPEVDRRGGTEIGHLGDFGLFLGRSGVILDFRVTWESFRHHFGVFVVPFLGPF